jgi:hypothetical protein
MEKKYPFLSTFSDLTDDSQQNRPTACFSAWKKFDNNLLTLALLDGNIKAHTRTKYHFDGFIESKNQFGHCTPKALCNEQSIMCGIGKSETIIIII